MENNKFNYNGSSVTFLSGKDDVMVNATEMASAFNKQPSDWIRLKSTNEFLIVLEGRRGIPRGGMIRIVNDGINNGTWLHTDVAIEFARWLSPDFAIWCNDRIKELLTRGYTTLDTISRKDLARLILASEEEKERLQLHLTVQNEQMSEMGNKIVELTKKTDYLEQILQSKETVTITQIAQDYGMSARKFNQILSEFRIQRKVNGQWILYSPYNTRGYVHSHTTEIKHKNGSTGTVLNTEWRQSGRIFLYEFLKEKGILPMIEK